MVQEETLWIKRGPILEFRTGPRISTARPCHRSEKKMTVTKWYTKCWHETWLTATNSHSVLHAQDWWLAVPVRREANVDTQPGSVHCMRSGSLINHTLLRVHLGLPALLDRCGLELDSPCVMRASGPACAEVLSTASPTSPTANKAEKLGTGTKYYYLHPEK
jgi:hypothetical protein